MDPSCIRVCLQRYGLQPARLLVHGTFQARILEWVAISSSRGSSQPRDQTHASVSAGGFFTTEPLGNPIQTHRNYQRVEKGHHCEPREASQMRQGYEE